MRKQIDKSNHRGAFVRVLVVSLCVCGLFAGNACSKKTPSSEQKNVLRSRLAEMGWYPSDPNILDRQIEGLFQKAEAQSIDNVIGLILPHAGYAYSGRTATAGIKAINGQYKQIVVIGPTHRLPMEDILSVPRATHYQTPLGLIPLDVELIDKLLEYSIFCHVPQAHEYGRGGQEHSVQIELPLLQHKQKDFKLVPIVAGQCSPETVEKAAAILKSLVDRDTLVVASSDFVHYGPNYGYVPFKEDIPEQIKKLDMGAYEHIAQLDGRGFLEYRRTTGATICGAVPIAILLSMLNKPAEARLVQYTTSGEISGDYTNSVSYLSVAFSGIWGEFPEIIPDANNAELTEHDKQQLLTLARKTMVYALTNRRVPEASDLDITPSAAMQSPRAAFVTLKKDGQLRGCIGDIFPQRPLYKSVILNAIHACVNDSRFKPVTLDECEDIVIEISALTPPSPVESSDQIRIGIDGVVLNKDGHSAVFLPQVAPEQGWNLDQTLSHLSQKAGLPADAWKEEASFLVFQADVFGENEK
ncbi:MAG: AmmeMemoRadiSam system protein B [Sedimentisphaerales bacterium]|nr:AmmeMemoRadiSam system protein B [Sedimentisphaerales bacterium]